jgi:hypothetical protein
VDAISRRTTLPKHKRELKNKKDNFQDKDSSLQKGAKPSKRVFND